MLNAYKNFLRELIRLVLPRQQNKGDGAVQAGRVGGNLTVINHHHGSRNRTTKVVNNHGRSTQEHRAVLQLMDGLRDRIAVLDFMEREFGTRMVIELEPKKLFRLKRYVETIIDSDAKRGKK